MSIILISRQMGSMGTEIAEMLSKEMNYSLLNKEKLENELLESGLKEVNVSKYDEINPGFWKSLSSEKDRYFNYLKYVIFKTAKKDDCVILGRGAQIILKDIPGILKLRFIAPLETRVKRVAEQYNCDEKNAEKIVLKDDSEKSGYHKTFFSMDWEDNSHYDIVINTENIGKDDINEIIKKILDILKGSKNTQAIIADKLLSQLIVNKMLYEENLPVNLFEVESSNGNVRLYGSVNVPSDIEVCEKAVAKIEGVKSIDNQIAFISDYPSYYSPY